MAKNIGTLGKYDTFFHNDISPIFNSYYPMKG